VLRLTQAAVPLLELCDRLEDSPLHPIPASSPELRTIVLGDLRTRLRQDATAAGYPRLASLMERLETRFRLPSGTGPGTVTGLSRPAASHQLFHPSGNGPWPETVPGKSAGVGLPGRSRPAVICLPTASRRSPPPAPLCCHFLRFWRVIPGRFNLSLPPRPVRCLSIVVVTRSAFHSHRRE